MGRWYPGPLGLGVVRAISRVEHQQQGGHAAAKHLLAGLRLDEMVVDAWEGLVHAGQP